MTRIRELGPRIGLAMAAALTELCCDWTHPGSHLAHVSVPLWMWHMKTESPTRSSSSCSMRNASLMRRLCNNIIKSNHTPVLSIPQHDSLSQTRDAVAKLPP